MRVAGGFEGGVEVDCVFFIEAGRGDVGASPCKKFSGGGGNFKVAVVGVGGECVWVSGDDEAESGCIEGEVAILVFRERNGCVVCAHLFHCCGGKSAADEGDVNACFFENGGRRWAGKYA